MSIEIAGMGFVLVILSLITIILVVIIWQALKTERSKTLSKAMLARDEAYRKLAEETAAAQKKMLEDHRRMAEDLADMRQRIVSIEKMLREVE